MEWKVIFRTWNRDQNCGGNAHSGFVPVNTATRIFHSSVCNFINFTLLWPRVFVCPIREQWNDSDKPTALLGTPADVSTYCVVSSCFDGLPVQRKPSALRRLCCDGWVLGIHDYKSNIAVTKIIYGSAEYKKVIIIMALSVSNCFERRRISTQSQNSISL